jgi:hypothetical protein
MPYISALWINLPGLTALLTICSLCGMVVYAEYKDCDPISTGRIVAKDQVVSGWIIRSNLLIGKFRIHIMYIHINSLEKFITKSTNRSQSICIQFGIFEI